MVEFRFLTPEEAAVPADHESDHYCACTDPEPVFDMEVIEGTVSLTCRTCGKSPDVDDIVCLTTAKPIPVTLTFVPEHPNLGGWHGLDRCDCGWWWEIEEARDV